MEQLYWSLYSADGSLGADGSQVASLICQAVDRDGWMAEVSLCTVLKKA